jgi:hypothetical protein
MATVVVAFDGTRVANADTESDSGGVWDKFDASQSPTVEGDFFYQGQASISNKVGTTANGVEFEDDNTNDLETTPRVILFKVLATNYGVLNVKGSTGMILYIGSGTTSDRYQYYVHGSDTYPTTGGWVFVPIDPNVSGYRDAQDGSPDLSVVKYYAITCDFTTASKSENVAMDAIDYIDSGTGLTLTNGDGGSTDGSFASFLAYDEGTIGNRYGVVRSAEGALIVLGVLTIGSSTVTEFTDSNAILIFPEGLVNAGFSGLDFGLQNSSTVISITNSIFKSNGSSGGSADTRPDYDVTGTSGSLTLSGCVFDTYRQVNLTSACSITDCSFLNGGAVDAGSGATLTGTVISDSTVAVDASALIWDVNLDPNGELDNMSISKGTNAHHAIEFGTTSPLTMTLTGIDFSGFNSSDAQNDSTFNVLRTSGTVTINVIGGSGNVSYKTAGATVVVVQNPVALTLTVSDITTGSPINGARAYVTADSVGPLPYQDSVTITRSGTTASVVHTSHGLSNGDKVFIEGADQSEYNGVQTISNVSVNGYDYTVSGAPDTPATGTITSTAVIIDGTTNASGIISDTRTYSSDQDFIGRVRKSTSPSPFYKTQPITGTIDKDSGLSVAVSMIRDE